jgi:chemotaxis protein CheD
MALGAASFTEFGTLPDERIETVIQGSFRLSSDPKLILSTVLGSCVAVCLFEPRAKVGGMNHYLLPQDRQGGSGDVKYGTYAMELLINGLLKAGAEKSGLVAKIFGGAKMFDNLNDIGAANAAFGLAFLARENIPVLAKDFGGVSARRVQFRPAWGTARMLTVPRSEVEEKLTPVKPAAPDIELF